MVLGLGYGDMIVVAIVAAVLVGPNDVPKVARLAGRATGRAVSLVSRFRERAVDLAGASEAGRLAEDLSRATRALEKVGADLRGGVSLRRAAGGAGAAAAPSTPSFAASPLVAPPPAAGTESVQVLPISAEAVRSAQRAAAQGGSGGGASLSSSSSSSASSSSPSSSPFMLTGSDVAAAAIEEEAVSQMAAKFLGTGLRQRQQQQRPERSKPER